MPEPTLGLLSDEQFDDMKKRTPPRWRVLRRLSEAEVEDFKNKVMALCEEYKVEIHGDEEAGTWLEYYDEQEHLRDSPVFGGFQPVLRVLEREGS